MDFVACMELLGEMMEYIRKQATALGVSDKTLNKVELACEEALVNIISYAYPKTKGHIQIECAEQGERVLIVIKDTGRFFNPVDAEINPQLETPVPDRKVGGLGIYLIRKIIDEASYQREGGENIFRLAFSK